MDLLWDADLWSLLDALDGIIDAEKLARRALEWDESVARPRKALYPSADVHADLWARHRADKNEYGVRDGRKVVLGHVFVRRDAPYDCGDRCHFCMCDTVICRHHEFVLRGKPAIRKYVTDAMYYDLWQ